MHAHAREEWSIGQVVLTIVMTDDRIYAVYMPVGLHVPKCPRSMPSLISKSPTIIQATPLKTDMYMEKKREIKN